MNRKPAVLVVDARGFKDMPTPEQLLPALRQYRHNNSDGFVAGYDKEVTEKLFADQQSKIDVLEKSLKLALDVIEDVDVYSHASRHPAFGVITLAIDEAE